jgi:hypothetical protein
VGGGSGSLITIKKIIEKRNQRSASASCRHVRGTKIRDDRNTKTSRDYRTLASLPCDGQLPAEKRLLHSLVIESLTVATDQIKFRAMSVRSLSDGLGIEFAEKEIHAR